MRILVLGGTVFLGRHVAAAALARGHDLTLFTRGVHGTDLFPEATRLVGDRAGDLSALAAGEWDAVIDTSGFQAEHVGRVCELLADRIGHYVFVSSCNAYPAWPEEDVDEDSPTWQSDDDEYGPQKAASERAAEAALPGRFATVRAGLICGPHDNVFRLPWWVKRIARGGRVPSPAPDRPVQLVDARDLAAWMIGLGERRTAGAFNGTSPPNRQTWGEVLDAAAAATGADVEFVWLSDEQLQAAEVEPWMELPLWIPAAAAPGTWQIGTERAQATGLRCRPIAETVADVWAWLRDGGESELDEWRSEHRPRPMSEERERAVMGTLPSHRA